MNAQMFSLLLLQTVFAFLVQATLYVSHPIGLNARNFHSWSFRLPLHCPEPCAPAERLVQWNGLTMAFLHSLRISVRAMLLCIMVKRCVPRSLSLYEQGKIIKPHSLIYRN